MTRTKKALIVVLSVLCAVCLAMFTFSACKKQEKEVVKLSKIQVTTPPDKISYVAGTEFDPTGMKVTAFFTDDTSKLLESTEWTYKAPSMTVDEGEFETTRGVSISYTFEEVTKTTTQSITITKKVVSAEVKSLPTKTEYFAGQFFDPTGIVIDVKFEDNTTEEGIAITRGNADFNPAQGIPSGTEKVAVTYGGYTFNIDITLKEGVWIEGETGLLNGNYPNQNTTEAGGNIGKDAQYEPWTDTKRGARESAVAMYLAQIKADYALAQLEADANVDTDALNAEPSKLYKDKNYTGFEVNGKQVTALYDEIVSWIAKNGTAVTKYLRDNGYEAWEEAVLDEDGNPTKDEEGNDVVIKHEATKLNEYIASPEYTEAVEHYHANNDVYLGGVGQGDVVSFVFNSDGVGTGSIEFRLASAYIGTNNNWTPAIMGDIQLNKLADVYVNGVKYNVPDSVVLEGGMTPDGSYNNILWVNWQEVGLDNIAFVAGRNVIEFAVKNHGIIAPGQTDYSWSCNVDSMYLKPADDAGCTLGTYDNSVEIVTTMTATAATVANANDVTNVTISGTYTAKANDADVSGYVADQLSIALGDASTLITTTNGNFSAIFDVTEYEVGTYAIKLNGEAITFTSESTVKVGHITYKFVADKDGYLVLDVSSDASITYEGVKIENVSGKIVITYTGSYVAYTEDELKAMVIDLEGADGRKVVDTTVTVGTEERDVPDTSEGAAEGATVKATVNTFSISIDVSDVENFPVSAGVNQAYWMHSGFKARPADLPATGIVIEKDKDKVTVNDRFEYSLKASGENGTGTLQLVINDAKPPVLSVSDIALKKQDDKAVLVIKGSVTNYYAEGISFYLATVHNGNWATPNRSDEIADNIVWGTPAKDGSNTYTITWVVSEASGLDIGNSYYIHFKIPTSTENDLPSKPIDADNMEAIVGTTRYWLKKNGDTNSPLLYVEAYDPTAKRLSVNPSNIELDSTNNKVYYVITGKADNYTQAELAALKLDFENAANSSDKTVISEDKVTVTLNNDGTFIYKADITDLGAAAYWTHFAPGTHSQNGDVTNGAGVAAVTCGNKTYGIKLFENYWSNYLFYVEAAPAA